MIRGWIFDFALYLALLFRTRVPRDWLEPCCIHHHALSRNRRFPGGGQEGPNWRRIRCVLGLWMWVIGSGTRFRRLGLWRPKFRFPETETAAGRDRFDYRASAE